MKVKNLNPVERHVEKVVLAAAVLAAGYIAYTGWQPIKIGPGNTVGAAEVEPAISTALENVRKGGFKTEQEISSGQLSVVVPNFMAEYERKANAPLDSQLTHANFRYLPPQTEAKMGPATTREAGGRKFAIEMPLPDVTNVHAMTARGKVRVSPPAETPPAPGAPAATPAAPAPGVEQDATIVRISGNYPMQELRDRIANIRDPNPRHRLDPALQIVALYRLEVQRQDRKADGTWPAADAGWKPIAQLKNAKPLEEMPFKRLQREQLKDAANAINAAAASILTPAMYETEDVNFFPPPPDPASTSSAPVTAPGPRRGTAATVRPPAPTPVFIPPEPMGGPGNFGGIPGPNGPVGGVTPYTPPTPFVAPEPAGTSRVVTEALPAVWAYDENVEAEHEYRYRMRAVVVNPTYKFERPQDLKQPEFVTEPLFYGSWVAAPETVTIKPTSFFYVVSNSSFGDKDRDKVDIQIFKFYMGKWYHAWQKDIRAGTFVGDVVWPNAENKGVDFSTGYTVVDVLPNGPDAMIVLLNASGQLVTRNIREDRQKAQDQQREIDAEGKRAGTATQPKTPTPTPGPTPVTPRMPPGMPAPQPNRANPHPIGVP